MPGCAPWLTAIKKLSAHGKGPGDARDKLVKNGIKDVTVPARIGAQHVIQQLDTNMYGTDRTGLSFVSLFRNN